MKHTVYLPNELSARAKAAGLPLSGLLRRAVENELERRTKMASTEFQEHLLDLSDPDGREFTGRLPAAKVIADDHGATVVYLAEDGRVIVHDEQEARYTELSSEPSNELRALLPTDQYIEAMEALGIPAVVDI